MVNNLPAIQETQVRSLDQEDPLEKEMEPTSVFLPGEFHGQWYCFAYKGPCSQSYDFSSSHLWMWELDNRKGWAPKNWCLQIVVLKKTLESPLDCKEIKPVNLKGYQFWIFIGSIDAEAETPILWPPDVRSWLTGKDPDAGKDWWQEEKGMTENKMIGWHQWLNGLEQALGVDDG